MTEAIVRHDTEDATVEVNLPTRVLPAGEDVEFDVHLTTKSDTYRVAKTTLAFETRYRTPDGYREFTAHEQVLAEGLSADGRLTETRTRTVSVPHELPCTIGSIDVWTEVRLETSRDAFEYDAQIQLPLIAPVRAIIRSMVDLGFVLRDAECILDRSSNGCPFLQRIEFRPTGDAMRDDVETVDVFVRPGEDETKLFGVTDRDSDDLTSVARTNEFEMTVGDGESGRVRDRLTTFVGRS